MMRQCVSICFALVFGVFAANAKGQEPIDPLSAIERGAADAQWTEHRKLSARVSGVCRTTIEYPLVDGESKKEQTEEEYSFREGCALLHHNEGGSSLVFGYNDRYAFSLKRPLRRDANAKWILTRLSRPPFKGENAQIHELITAPNTLATSIAGLFVGDYISHAASRIVEQKLEGELLVVEVIHEGAAGSATENWPRKAAITFDPANSFVIKKWRAIHAKGTVSDAELDYRVVDGVAILVERRSSDWKTEDAKDPLAKGVEEYDLTFPVVEIPREKFTIASFGGPEPPDR